MSHYQDRLDIVEAQLQVAQDKREELIKNRAAYAGQLKGWDFYYDIGSSKVENEMALILNQAEITAGQQMRAHLRACLKTEQPRLAQLPK